MSDLFGLILCGGNSSRMGEDKSLLNYYGRPQRYFLYDLLQPFCKNVFMSCNNKQSPNILPHYNIIVDDEKYADIGPMTALLSAFEKFPAKSFFVIACDYPFITAKHIRDLIEARVEKHDAICYCHPETDFHEPLICIYENDSQKKLFNNFEEKKYSLRHFLEEVNICKVIPVTTNFLKSVDNVESYRKAKEVLAAKFF